MGGGPEEEHLLVTLPIPPEALQPHLDALRASHPHLTISSHPTLPDSTPVPSHLYHPVTILLTLRALPPSDLIPSQHYPNLKIIHFFSAGIPPPLITHPIYTSTTITLTTSSGISAPQIAEYVALTELAARRKFLPLARNQAEHRWEHSSLRLGDVGDGVGRTVGILGYGGIGRQVGRVLNAFGWKVLAYTASARPDAEARREIGKFTVPGTGDVQGKVPVAWYSGTETGDVRKFLEAKNEGGLDWLVICVPLTAGTKGLLSSVEFSILGAGSKRGRCYVTNISRGPVVDTLALMDALDVCRDEDKEGALLRGAALDVTDPEPLPENSPLWDVPNVTITPHVSGLGSDYAKRSFEILDQNLGRKDEGKELLNVVNRRRGY